MGAVTGGGGSLVCSHASCAGVNGSAGASASVDISPADDGERAREVIGGKGGWASVVLWLTISGGAPRLGIVRGVGGVWPRESSHGSLAGVVSAA